MICRCQLQIVNFGPVDCASCECNGRVQVQGEGSVVGGGGPRTLTAHPLRPGPVGVTLISRSSYTYIKPLHLILYDYEKLKLRIDSEISHLRWNKGSFNGFTEEHFLLSLSYCSYNMKQFSFV